MDDIFHLIDWFLSHDEQEQWLLCYCLFGPTPAFLYFIISISLSLSLSFLFFFSFLWTRKFGNVICVMWCLLKLKQVDWLNFIADKIEKKGTLHCFLSFLLLFFFFFFFFFNPWNKSFLLSFWPANKTNNEMVFLYS